MIEEKFNLSDEIKKSPAYVNSYQLAKEVWEEVLSWDNFSKFSIGNQLVRTADSISANIAEGYGRYFYKEKIKFYYYARGSLLEAVDWLRKTYDRKLISEEKIKELRILISKIEKDLSVLIYRTRSQY